MTPFLAAPTTPAARRGGRPLANHPLPGETGLDAALIHSAIDTVPSPNSLLARMGGARGIVRENGGLVVVVSAYEWNEEVTPVGAWLGGYLDAGGKQASAFFLSLFFSFVLFSALYLSRYSSR